MRVDQFDRAAEGFAEADLGLAHDRLDAEFGAHAVDRDFEVQLAHALEHGFAGFLVDFEAQRRIGLGHLVERGRHLVDVVAVLRLDRDADHRIREAHALEQDRMRRVGQRIARLGVLHRDERADVAGAHFVDVLGRIGLHLDDAADALLLAARDIEQGVALLDHPRIDAAERQRAELVVDDLEGQRAGRRVVAHFLLADDLAVGVDHRDAAVLARIRQVVDDAVEQLLDALVAVGGAAEHRHQLAADRALADALLEHGRIELASFEQALEGVVVHGQGGFEHVLAQLRQLVDPVVVGSRGEVEARAQFFERYRFPGAVLVVRGPDVADAGDQVGHAAEFVIAAERDLAEQGVGAEALADAFHAMREVGADAVHLVDVAHARHVVLVGQAPVGLGLRLDAGDAVEDHNRAVENAQRTVHLDREIDVSGRIDDVDLEALPLGRDRRALDRDAALALLLHVVGRGRALAVLGVVHVDDLVLATGVIEHALRGRRLARVDVGDDSDVAVELELFLPGHGSSLMPEMKMPGRTDRRSKNAPAFDHEKDDTRPTSIGALDRAAVRWLSWKLHLLPRPDADRDPYGPSGPA